jgi:putative heme-binding domain-containing protein
MKTAVRRIWIAFGGWLAFSCLWMEAGAADLQEQHLQQLKLPPGFQVELVHAVDPETQGSWVSLAVDDTGRIIASDQLGGLFRISLGPNSAGSNTRPRVESLDLAVGHAHGLLFAFDSLYVVVAANEYDGPGLYRARDTDGDDQFDEVRLLRQLNGTGEHGPHSIVRGPDGRSLYLCAGNKTSIPKLDTSRVPRHWGEDDLLPRIWGPIGSEAGTPAPGGWIVRLDPDGSDLELIATGFRNAFDLAFNHQGDMFTFDADAEFDMNTPWYQPTRVLHVVSGADFGWRSGSGKWPPYFADTLPPVSEVGAGSPAGVVFGYQTRFPAKYRESLFLCDWSHGRLMSLRLQAEGASYRGELEEFMSAIPLPITDIVVHPNDGAIYFALGGRRTTSGLYRLSYVGESRVPGRVASGESAGASVDSTPATSTVAALRRRLEALHGSEIGQEAIDIAWGHLGHADRFVSHAARIVLEHAPPDLWQDRALDEPSPNARRTALLALSRRGDRAVLPRLLQALEHTDWEQLGTAQRLAQLRCYDLALCRMASPSSRDVDRTNTATLEHRARFDDLTSRLEKRFPTGHRLVDRELCKVLIYLQSDEIASKALARLRGSSTRQDQLQYAIWLRHLRAGWTTELRREFFEWLRMAASWSGGLSFPKYIEAIDNDTRATMSGAELELLGDVARPTERLPTGPRQTGAADPSRPFVKKWKLEDLLPLTSRRGKSVENGRRLFAVTDCFSCHRFHGEGGTVGPDLTTVGRRFSRRDLIESIVNPSKAISDQYAAVSVITTAGRIVTGRVVNLVGGTVMIQTDMLRPASLERIPRAEIEQMERTQVSMMPTGLIDTLTRDEIADLVDFLSGPVAE